MKIKKLSQVTLEEALTAWNKGFEGYIVPIKMDIQAFVNRMASEGLSPEKSIVVFMHGEPCGIIMNGFRKINGRKIAWNGGTGIAPQYRGKGLSAAMMSEVLSIYKAENVQTAVLEAIEENERAIKLYKKAGYAITDQLLYLNKKLTQKEIGPLMESHLAIKKIYPEQLQSLRFYDIDAAWQCQWQSVKQGEAAVLMSEDGKEDGYILYKRVLAAGGRTERIIIYQLKFTDGSAYEAMTESILGQLFLDQDDSIDFTAVNISASNPASKALLKMGFEKKIGQVMMKKTL
ncbi:acetyltransferase (GNAT) family protein [Cytobacillus firmus]|uniref:Acetyltransferase (GNAT) family protein n=2 Tax=Cytobacillus TaxID=2675230 RepID=A0A366K345_CYTFI|nr:MULTISPECIES: GNAT family N-acetyltransferase [Cytobacillus]RBP95697.1 acetyltransferase (GNAT) family protein [Cytobacillus firmus]TDX44610.1 acetyltransferase (GNAT) family protein [Cytobacillus oceanisediminis]